MPTVTHLAGYNVGCGKLPPDAAADWRLQFTDQRTGDQIVFDFPEGVRDYLLQRLQHGIVVPNGGMPKLGGAGL